MTATGDDESVVVPSPSWPEAFDPQHSTAPPEARAHMDRSPAEIAVTPVSPATVTAVSAIPAFGVCPQHLTVPFESKAHANVCPTEMAVTPPRPLTATGVYLSVVVPSPSSPKELSPQHFTPPEARSAQAEFTPAAIAVTFARPVTGTGVVPHGADVPNEVQVCGPVLEPLPSAISEESPHNSSGTERKYVSS